MSDEMVQEKTDTTAAVTPENGRAAGGADETAAAEAVSSPVGAAPASAEEPETTPAGETSAPIAQTAEPTPPASPAEASGPVPSIEHAGEDSHSDAAEFEREMRSLDHQYDESLRALREGDVIWGTVMRVDREGVLVDVGAKSEGIIRLNELSRDPNFNLAEEIKVGDKIRVFVLEGENQDGNPILSKKRADFEQAWDKVQQAKETGETLHAMVTDRIKGGLTVDLGIRGFVPASHVGSGSLKNNLEKYVGQSIALKVIEVDKERRKVVLSNKMAMQEEREAKSAETKASLAPGQVRRGIVRRLTNYGAFIDLGGIDGLLHISEMSWTRINDPKEVLKEGQELDVLILKMDLENNRVSLGLRQILPDPWSEIANRYKEGDVITGTVTRLVPFGAFVQVDGGVEGIIPNNEMPRGRAKGQPAINSNDQVEVKVIGLRPEERKMTLSMRALQPVEEREMGASREQGGGGTPAAGGRERSGRDRGERDDYSRYVSRDEEPRFTIGDAIEAQRRERKRDRRFVQEEDTFDDYQDLEIDEVAAEPDAEVDAEAEVEAAPEAAKEE